MLHEKQRTVLNIVSDLLWRLYRQNVSPFAEKSRTLEELRLCLSKKDPFF